MSPEGLPTVLAVEERPRPLSRAAVVGLLASVAWAVAYFALPWLTFSPAQRTRLPTALEPELVALEEHDPETVARYRALLLDVEHHGALTGHDLRRYVRAAAALNRALEGEAPAGRPSDRAAVIQRALPLVAGVLAELPAASALAILLLLSRTLRTPGTIALTLLLVTGVVGSTFSLAWERWADALATEVPRGAGLSTALAASLAQASAGLFGVKARTWWRVYGLAALVLALGAWAGWAHVMQGWSP